MFCLVNVPMTAAIIGKRLSCAVVAHLLAGNSWLFRRPPRQSGLPILRQNDTRCEYVSEGARRAG